MANPYAKIILIPDLSRVFLLKIQDAALAVALCGLSN